MTIDRQLAIEFLTRALWATPNELYSSFNCYENCEKFVKEAFQRLPSAEPRKKGKWNTYYHSDIEFSHSCNQCGYSAPYQMIGGEVFQKKWNFCPNCGSYNGGEQE